MALIWGLTGFILLPAGILSSLGALTAFIIVSHNLLSTSRGRRLWTIATTAIVVFLGIASAYLDASRQAAALPTFAIMSLFALPFYGLSVACMWFVAAGAKRYCLLWLAGSLVLAVAGAPAATEAGYLSEQNNFLSMCLLGEPVIWVICTIIAALKCQKIASDVLIAGCGSTDTSLSNLAGNRPESSALKAAQCLWALSAIAWAAVLYFFGAMAGSAPA